MSILSPAIFPCVCSRLEHQQQSKLYHTILLNKSSAGHDCDKNTWTLPSFTLANTCVLYCTSTNALPLTCLLTGAGDFWTLLMSQDKPGCRRVIWRATRSFIMEWSACLSFMAPMFVDLVVYRVVSPKMCLCGANDLSPWSRVERRGSRSGSRPSVLPHAQPHVTGPCVSQGAMGPPTLPTI